MIKNMIPGKLYKLKSSITAFDRDQYLTYLNNTKVINLNFPNIKYIEKNSIIMILDIFPDTQLLISDNFVTFVSGKEIMINVYRNVIKNLEEII